MNKVRVGIVAGSLVAGTALAIASATPATAATDWQVGQCYQLTQSQIDANSVPDAAAVPCSSEHNIEVTYVGITPVATDLEQWQSLREHCAGTDLYAAAGKPIKKAITGRGGGALTYLNRASWVTASGNGLVCASAPIWFAKKGRASFQTTTDSLVEQLRASTRTAPYAGTCLSTHVPGRQLSTSCDPRHSAKAPWVVWKIVNAAARYPQGFPGSAALSRFAKVRCALAGTETAWTYPQADAWRMGAILVNCYRHANLSTLSSSSL